jgi:hypothetical protein
MAPPLKENPSRKTLLQRERRWANKEKEEAEKAAKEKQKEDEKEKKEAEDAEKRRDARERKRKSRAQKRARALLEEAMSAERTTPDVSLQREILQNHHSVQLDAQQRLSSAPRDFVTDQLRIIREL